MHQQGVAARHRHERAGRGVGEQIGVAWRAEQIGHHEHAGGRPGEHVQVETRGTVVEGPQRRAAPGQRRQRAGGGAVDGLAVGVEPAAHRLETLHALGRDAAIRVGADVQQEVAALGGDVDQRAHQVAGGLEVVVGAVVAPVVVHRHAGLPVDAGQALRRDLLLGRAGSRREFHPAAPDAVVDDDVGLQGAHEVVEVAAALVVPGALPLAVEPEDVDGAVVREQLAHLGLQVRDVTREVGVRDGTIPLPVAAGQVVGVAPVHDGVVPAEADALAAAGVGHLAHHVTAQRRGHDVEVGLVRIEEAEAVVVLGGDDQVPHAGALGEAGPGTRVEVGRREVGAEAVVLVERDLGRGADPLGVVGAAVPLAGRDGVKAPVDEHAEARLAPPVQAGIGRIGHGDAGHQDGREQGERLHEVIAFSIRRSGTSHMTATAT